VGHYQDLSREPKKEIAVDAIAQRPTQELQHKTIRIGI
jgi:hypothetical protein